MQLRAEHGFTLVEMLVAMAITVVVFGATLTALNVFQTNTRFDQLRNENQDHARTAMDRISRQLRNVIARTTSLGVAPGALELAEPYSVVFQTVDISGAAAGENATDAMRVRYCLDNSTPENETLWAEVQKWTSADPLPIPSTSTCPAALSPEGWETKTQLVSHLTNRIHGKGEPERCASETPPRCLFIYSAKEAPQILSLETALFLNINPSQRRPGETELTSGVSLRNANREPIAELTATEEGKREVRLNASASYDPGGLTLTYKWWQDGTPLTTTASQYVTEAFTAGSSHTFELEVTNPGNLSSTIEKTVEIK
jgi:prepilin-type N-terminal cleavage/methylation domain-containing protein